MKLIDKFKLVLPLLLYGVFYIGAFAILERIDRSWYLTPVLKIDSLIPFVPVFIIPYFLWFALIPIMCAYLLFNDEREFVKTRLMLITGMSVFLLFSAVLPTKLDLRPDVYPTEGLIGFLFARLYSADTPTNVFPSIHVYNTCVIWWSFMQSSGEHSGKPVYRVIVSTISILICLSTMLIKQHSVVDVAGAVIMFLIIAAAAEYLFGNRAAGNTGNYKKILMNR